MVCKDKWAQWTQDLKDITGMAAGSVDGAARCIKCDRPLLRDGRCVMGHSQDSQGLPAYYPEELEAVLCAYQELVGPRSRRWGKDSRVQAVQGFLGRINEEGLPPPPRAEETYALGVTLMSGLLTLLDEACPEAQNDPRIQVAHAFLAYRHVAEQVEAEGKAQAYEVVVVSLLVEEADAEQVADEATDNTAALSYVAHLGARDEPAEPADLAVVEDMLGEDMGGRPLRVVSVEMLVPQRQGADILDEAMDMTSSLPYVAHLGSHLRPATGADVTAAEAALGEELPDPGLPDQRAAQWLWDNALCLFEESDLYSDYEVDDELWQQAMEDVQAYMEGRETPTLRDSLRYLLNEVLEPFQESRLYEDYGLDDDQWDEALEVWREYVDEDIPSWSAGSPWEMLRDRWGSQSDEAEWWAAEAAAQDFPAEAQRVRVAAAKVRLLGACAEVLRQYAEYAEMDSTVPTSGAGEPFNALREEVEGAQRAGLTQEYPPLQAAMEVVRQAEEYAAMSSDVPTFGAGEPFTPLLEAVSDVRQQAQAELATALAALE